MVDNASLLGGSGRVDSLEPASHELGKVEAFGGGGEQGVGHIVCQRLQLLWWEHVSKRRSIGDTASDRTYKNYLLNLQMN